MSKTHPPSTVGDGPAMTLTIPIIGYVRTPFTEKFGVPRQPNLVDVAGVIEMIPPYDQAAAFDGLAAFSHLWLIWQFHLNRESKKATHQAHLDESAGAFRAQIRPPRLGGNQKIGVFASRSMYRPAPLGLSVVRLERIEVIDGRARLHIRGADLVDGTPLVDIKPYVAYSDALPDAVSGFASDAPALCAVYWAADALVQRDQLRAAGVLDDAAIHVMEQVLAQDPRPAYQDDGREYGFTFAGFNLRFRCQENALWIEAIAIVAAS